jgi:hypothetical protein
MARKRSTAKRKPRGRSEPIATSTVTWLRTRRNS